MHVCVCTVCICMCINYYTVFKIYVYVHVCMYVCRLHELETVFLAYHRDTELSLSMGWFHEIIQGTYFSAAYLGDLVLLRKHLNLMTTSFGAWYGHVPYIHTYIHTSPQTHTQTALLTYTYIHVSLQQIPIILLT
jgi:hypothetical protein